MSSPVCLALDGFNSRTTGSNRTVYYHCRCKNLPRSPPSGHPQGSIQANEIYELFKFSPLFLLWAKSHSVYMFRQSNSTC